MAEVALRTKVSKICCSLIALRFQSFFFSVNRAILYIELTFVPFRLQYRQMLAFLSKLFAFFRFEIAKNAVLLCVVKFQLRKLGCALTWNKNAVPQ